MSAPHPAVTAFDLSGARVVVIANAGSGRKDAPAQLDLVRSTLEPKVGALQIREIRHGREIEPAARRAVSEGADLVVALGGDGTQSAVAGALADTGVAMGVLPGGTFNYFARALGVGETLDEALQTILRGQTRRRDLAELNGRIFLNNASFGLYPAILERREAIYKRWGRSRLAAYVSVVLGLRDLGDPLHLQITINGETREYHTPLAFIACSSYQLESLGLAGVEAVRNGHFALFVAGNHGRMGLIGAAFRLALGQSRKGEDFELVEAEEITIDKRRYNLPIAFDGEKVRMPGPYHLKMRPDALVLLAPPAAEAPETGEGGGLRDGAADPAAPRTEVGGGGDTGTAA